MDTLFMYLGYRIAGHMRPLVSKVRPLCVSTKFRAHQWTGDPRTYQATEKRRHGPPPLTSLATKALATQVDRTFSQGLLVVSESYR
jgi:hypothetical protein